MIQNAGAKHSCIALLAALLVGFTAFIGVLIAVVAERTIRNFATVLLLAGTAATLQFALYSWESMQNSNRREFPHVITYHYSGDLTLHVLSGIVVLIGTLVLGGSLAATIRYSRRDNNTQ